MLIIENLQKKYDKNIAVNNISLNVKKGEIFGLLGPNGAGKTTVINCICGLTKIDSGNIMVDGKDIRKSPLDVKQEMGVVPQEIALVEELSAYDNCMFMGALYGLKGSKLKARVEEALNFVNLWDRRKENPMKYSGGMKRRLNIACAIVQKPKLLIMDEPTVGVDPQSRSYILESIKKLNKEGTTIIYTSHYMEEVEEICTRIAIMDLGRIIAEGTNNELKDSIDKEEIVKIEANGIKKENIKDILNIENVNRYELTGDYLIVYSAKNSTNLKNIIEYLNNKDISFGSINMVEPTLEQVFLLKTGKKLRD